MGAPLTPAVFPPSRLRALVVLVAIGMLAAGVIAGQVARRAALFDLQDATFTADAVTVGYADGNGALAGGALVIALVVLAGIAWWLRGFATSQGGEARTWTLAMAGAWLVAVAGAAGGWATTTAEEGIRATSVADFLRDSGVDVGATITAGEGDVVRPGSGSSTTLTAPVVIEYRVDSAVCTLVVDDPLVGDGSTLVLTPSC